MVDASGGRLDPTATEVMVQTGMVKSPAKVICHAPSAVEGQLRLVPMFILSLVSMLALI